MKKAFYLSIISVLLVTLIAGCSSDKNESPAQASNANASSPKPSTAGVTIHAAMQKHSAVEAVKALVSEFEEQTNIKVEFDILPQEEIFSKTELALASNSGQYDVIMTENMFIPKYHKSGWLTDLNPLIKANNLDTSDFSQGFLNALSHDGATYGIPFYGESTMLMYNKEIFEKNGITSPPTTMDELVDVAKKLTKDGEYGIAMRGLRGQGMNVYVWAGFFNAFGGKWFTDGKPTVNSPEGIKSVEVFADLLKNYSPLGGTEFSWDQVQLNLQQGNVAMAIDATNFASRVEDPENSKVVGKIGYADVPSGPAGFFPSISTWGLAIPKSSKHADAAFEFITWVTSKEIQLRTALEGNRADVTRTSVFEDPKYKERYNYDNGQWVATVSNAFNKSNPDYRPPIEQWNQFGDRLGIAVSEAMAGKSAKDALDQAQKDIEGYLK